MKALLLITTLLLSLNALSFEREKFSCSVEFNSQKFQNEKNNEAVCDDIYQNTKVQHMLNRLDVVFTSKEAVMEVEVESFGFYYEGQALVMNFKIIDGEEVKRKFTLQGMRNASKEKGGSVLIDDYR